MPPLDSLPAPALRAIEAEALEMSRDRRFGFFTDSLRGELRPSIDLKALRSVRWPPRALSAQTKLLFALIGAAVLCAAAWFLAALQRASQAREGVPWRVLFGGIQIGLSIALAAGYLASGTASAWDFKTFYLAGLAARHGLSPYNSEVLASLGADPGLPFLYSPITLALFVPLSFLPLKVAALLWLGLKLVAACGLVALWRRFVVGRVNVGVLAVLATFGLNAALLIDLKSGNIATIEAALLWLAFLLFVRGRRSWFAAVVVAAALIKLMPIVFLGLLLVPSERRGPSWRVLGAGIAAFAVILGLVQFGGAPWSVGYLHNIPAERPFGESNPSALGLMDMLLGRVGSHAPGTSGLAVALWFVCCAGLLWFSRPTLRDAWRRKSPESWVSIAVLFYALLSPRMIVYSYSLVVLPAFLLASQIWTRGWQRAIAVVLIAAQGIVERGLLHLDSIPAGQPPIWTFIIGNAPYLLILGLWIGLVVTRSSGAGDQGA